MALGTAVFCGIGPNFSEQTLFVALIVISSLAAALLLFVHLRDVDIDARTLEGGLAPAPPADHREEGQGGAAVLPGKENTSTGATS